MDTFTSLTPGQLRRAANIKEKIEELEGELGRILGAKAPIAPSAGPARRKISAAGIARIRAAQKARWAAIKRSKPAGEAAPRRKRKITAAGRARLAALARARWAKVKASGKSRL